jgi:hypothetical protein
MALLPSQGGDDDFDNVLQARYHDGTAWTMRTVLTVTVAGIIAPRCRAIE